MREKDTKEPVIHTHQTIVLSDIWRLSDCLQISPLPSIRARPSSETSSVEKSFRNTHKIDHLLEHRWWIFIKLQTGFEYHSLLFSKTHVTNDDVKRNRDIYHFQSMSKISSWMKKEENISRKSCKNNFQFVC